MITEASWPVLSGNGCELRVLAVGDADTWLAGEGAEQRRWYESPPASRENVVTAITDWRRSWATASPIRHWGIWARPDGPLAGGVELRNRGDRRANLSYVVFPSHRRRGLASEASTLAAQWALNAWPIDAVVACIDERNVASRGVVESAGFSADGLADPHESSESGVMLRYVFRRRKPDGA